MLAGHHGAQICVSHLVVSRPPWYTDLCILSCFFTIFIDKLNNGFYNNVPAVASTVRFDDSDNVLSVPESSNTIFCNFMFRIMDAPKRVFLLRSNRIRQPAK